MSADWLQLLAEDAPESAFETMRDLVAARAPADERDAVLAEAALALEVRAVLAERSRRSHELAVLHEITSQLTALRDLDRLLQDIASRARELIDVDIAYLALRNDDGDLTIRVAAGTMGTRLRGLLMPADVGIVGEVVTSGRSFWTADYRNEPAITHARTADEVAADEGLGGILGVPLRVREEIVGVLFAADRAVRGFDDQEVALLASLASHAAAAIDNARLYASLRSAADELELANAELRASVSAIDRAATLHEQLTGIVVRGGGVAEIVAALSNVLGDVVRFHTPDDMSPALRAAVEAGGGRATQQTRVIHVEGDAQATAAPVVVGDDTLAFLLVDGDLVSNDADLRLLERAALVTALVLVRDRSVVAAERRARHELVAALLRRSSSSEVLHRRAASAGLRPGVPHVVVVLAPGERGLSSASATGEEIAGQFGGIAGEHDGEVVVLCNVDDEDEVAGWVRQHVDARTGTAGVATSARGLEHLPDAYAEARRCVIAAAALGRAGEVATPSSLGIYRFLLGRRDEAEAADFVARVLERLVAADEERGSDLLATVDAYLTAGRHHTAAAESLHIHPNTLYQRLAKVEQLLGPGWRDADRALELQLALRLRRVADALG